MLSSKKFPARSQTVPLYGLLSGRLLGAIRDALEPLGFAYCGRLIRGVLFSRPDGVAVAVDHQICDSRAPFEYSAYSDEQNRLMSQHTALYRGVVDTVEDVEEFRTSISSLLSHSYENADCVPASGTNREITAIDPTMPEAYFEQAFIEVYGRESLDCLAREYPILDVAGSNRFVDYYLERSCGNVAIEKNGVSYHHPQIIGKERYLNQLLKQNSLVSYGAKVYRWSLEGMKFTDRFHEELRQYLGPADTFFSSRKVTVSRGFSLHPYQGNALETVKACRARQERAALLVLPTGTGKTEILIADYAALSAEWGRRLRALILVPTIQLKSQMIQAFLQRLNDHGFDTHHWTIAENRESDVVVQTYAWSSRHLHSFHAEEFDYIGIDEAHHAVAPALRKVIQRFNPKFMLGLTATDQRLDALKLEDVFGKYDVELSLVEAIRQNLLAPIKAFRLVSNVDLSEVRFNGRDYVNADLERTVIVPSRNQLIIDVLKRYFVDSGLERKSGLIFCVNVKHAESLAAAMRAQGVSAESVSGKDAQSATKIERYQAGEVQFLTTCSLLNEGWDSPRTSVIVMARPTMSKVLYTQQLGRGTRKYPGKEALYVIDVVDNYGFLGSLKNTPWSLNAILGCSQYRPWGNPLDVKGSSGMEETLLAGLYEAERAIQEIDIFTFEYKYPNHLSDEQLARELFVSTDTLRSWVKKGKVTATVTIPLGRNLLNYYRPESVDEIRLNLGLKVHDESTQYEDFFEFLEERNYSKSYKMVMMLSMLKLVDGHGECDLNDLSRQYARFYTDRLRLGLPVDRPGCPYTLESLENHDETKQSILKFPFEKFERKRFLYQCKDLNRISFSGRLWEKLAYTGDLVRVKTQMFDDLVNYYKELGGIPNARELRQEWNLVEPEAKPMALVENPPDPLKFVEYVPYFDLAAAAGSFGLEQSVTEAFSGWLHLPGERLQPETFVLRIQGRSMEPRIPNGSLAMFRGGNALGGTREGRTMLVQCSDLLDPETGFSFTVKQYSSKKRYNEDGNFENQRIELKPLNPEFDSILLEESDESTFRVLGEFVRVVSVP